MSEFVDKMRAFGIAMREQGKEIAALKTEVEQTGQNIEQSLEQILKDARDSLLPIPTPGAAWDARLNYTTGDEITIDGVTYVALKYNRGQDPREHPELWEVKKEVFILFWQDVESGYSFVVGDIVEHNKLKWRCIKAHTKSQVRVPLDGSQWWEVMK